MKTSRCVILIALLVLVAGNTALTDSLSNIRIYPSEVSLALGRTQQFQLFGIDTQGNVAPVEGPITWSFGNPMAGTVSSDGVLIAMNTAPQTGITAVPEGITSPITTWVEILFPSPQDGYCLERRWRSWPPGVAYQPGVVFDAQGNMYGAGISKPYVWKFGPDGKLLGRLDLKPSPNGQPTYTKCMTTDGKSLLYVQDTLNRIQKFAADGSYLGCVGSEPPGNPPLPAARYMATDTQGNLYLTSGYSPIVKFGPDGNHIASFGFYGPQVSSIAVDRYGNIYLAQPTINMVQKLDPQGQSIPKWKNGSADQGTFAFPIAVTTDTEGNVYVVEKGNNRIQKLDSNGNLFAQWSISNYSSYPPVHPSIAVDTAGHVRAYVTCFEEFAPASAFTVGQAKQQPDNARVMLYGQVVTAGTPDMGGSCFYVESPNKAGGVKITGTQAERGSMVSIHGTWATMNGEREIKAIEVTPTGTGSAAPAYVNLTALGGSKFGYQDGTGHWITTIINGKRQQQWEPTVGLNNVGLLVRTSGIVVSTPQGNSFVLSTDGGQVVSIKCTFPSGVIPPQRNDYVVATGICSCLPERIGGLTPILKIRDQNDIQVMDTPH